MATVKIILLINICCKLSMVCNECDSAMGVETPYSNGTDERNLGF